MRLYRGLKEPYRSDLVPGGIRGTDFTDCPYTALQYARGRRSTLIVLDLPPEGGAHVSEEDWLGPKAKRLMVWGRFDAYITAFVDAKDLRGIVRAKGMAALPDRDKAEILRRHLGRAFPEPVAEDGPDRDKP